MTDLSHLAALDDDTLIAAIRHAATVLDPPPPGLLDTVLATVGRPRDENPGAAT